MKQILLLLFLAKVVVNCSTYKLSRISFENEEFVRYYTMKSEANLKHEIKSLLTFLNYNKLASIVSKDYKLPFCEFVIKEDSLEVFFNSKLVSSLNDRPNTLSIHFTTQHTHISISSSFITKDSTEVYMYGTSKRVKSEKNTIKIHELNKKERIGRYIQYDEEHLAVKGIYKLLDHARIDTFIIIDYDTYEETLELKHYDHTWYKDGEWKYFSDDGSILKTEDFSNQKIRLSQFFTRGF